MSATATNESFLANNAGTLTGTVPSFSEFFETLLGSVDAEEVEVGKAPKRNERREILRDYRLGRKTAKKTNRFLRAQTSKNLNYAQTTAAPLLKRLVDSLPGTKEGNTLLEKLNAQANTDLDAGRSLTAGETRTAQQGAREAFAARGLANSQPAAIGEVLNRHEFGEQRYRQRQQFAQGLIGQNFAQSAKYDPLSRLGIGNFAQQSAATIPGTMHLAQGIRNQDAAAQLGITQQQASIDSAASLQNAQLGTQANLQANGFGYDNHNTQLNHLYGSQIAQLNYEAAQQAQGSSLAGSALGAVGSIFGGGLGGGGGFLSGLF